MCSDRTGSNTGSSQPSQTRAGRRPDAGASDASVTRTRLASRQDRRVDLAYPGAGTGWLLTGQLPQVDDLVRGRLGDVGDRLADAAEHHRGTILVHHLQRVRLT